MAITETPAEITQVVDRYIAAWNETDPARRRELLSGALTADGRYLDPLGRAEGRDAIDGMMGAVQQQFPGFRFHRTSDVDSHNDRLRFTWELGPEGGEPFSAGVDFCVLEGGQISSITGFIDYMKGADAS